MNDSQSVSSQQSVGPSGVDSPSRTAANLLVVTSTSIAQIIVQFLFFRQLAVTFAFAEQADALAAALAVPSVIAAMLTGSLGYVLIPELVAKFSREESSEAGWELAWYTGWWTAGIGAAVSLVILVFSPWICDLLYGGLSVTARADTVRLMRILSVQVLLTSSLSWAQATYHARHRFVIPSLGGVVGITAGLLLVIYRGHEDIAYFAWAINLGSLISALIHIVPMLVHWRWPRADTASLWRLVAGLWPLVTGAALIRLDPLIDRILADALHSTGAIAAIHYSQRIMSALLALGTSSLSLIVFPQLSQCLAQQGTVGLRRHLAKSLRQLVLLIVPIAVGVGVFAERIIADLLVRGEFTHDDARLVGWLVVALLGMFVGASSGDLLARAFYALGDTRTPTFVGLTSMLIGLSAKIVMFQWIGLWAIPLGTSGYFLLSTAVMGGILGRRIGCSAFDGLVTRVMVAIGAALVACGCSYAVYQSKLGNTWVAAPVGAAVYFACLWVSGIDDARLLWLEVKQKLVGKSG